MLKLIGIFSVVSFLLFDYYYEKSYTRYTSKEYLNMAAFRIAVLLLIKS